MSEVTISLLTEELSAVRKQLDKAEQQLDDERMQVHFLCVGTPNGDGWPAPSRLTSQEPGAHDISTIDRELSGYYWRSRPGMVTIPVIDSRHNGQGHVSRFLDALPHDERIEFRCVLSQVLVAALAKRGFHRESIPVPELGEIDYDAWVREPKEPPP